VDEETINGYKNEICILISLQDTCDCGIIQTIDSQVDLERKLILVVIEFSQEDLKCCALQERPHSPWTTYDLIGSKWLLLWGRRVIENNIIRRDFKTSKLRLCWSCSEAD